MSRRYGRNQKRAHRQRIAELEEAYTREQGLSAYLLNKLDGLRTEVEDAKRELGQDHIAFHPRAVRVSSLADDRFRMARMPELHPFENDRAFELSLSEVVFRTLKLNVKRQEDLLHINVELADGRVCYAISERALPSISYEGFLRHVSLSLTQQLAVELQRLQLLRPRRK